MHDVEALAQDVGRLVVALGDHRLLQADQVRLEFAHAVDEHAATILPTGAVGEDVVRPEPDVGVTPGVPSGNGRDRH